MPPPRSAPKDRRSGFALLITITLLAFLVLLLVSLASLTRVETQVATNTQQLSKARQNALMALNIALGRLQSLAGPDQRVTATAEIVTGVHDDKRKWTGVWKTTVASPSPEWLVSTAAAASATGTTSVTTAMPTTGGTVNLVGNNSVDTTTDGNAITVETQPITSTSVPGVPGPQTVGNFAYWVGDEGVKAKVSPGDPWKSTTAGDSILTATGVSTTDADTFSFFGAQRSGIEGISSTGANTSTASKVDTAYPASTNATFRAALPKVLSLQQLPISYTAGEAALTPAIKNRFHDLTASSYTVLADVSPGANGGGLKKDLTAWIGRPADSPASSTLIPLSSALQTETYGLPKWGIIRDYAKLLADGTAKSPVAQTDEKQGLFPIVTFAQLGFGATCPGVDQPFRVHLFPQVVLWNPTNVTMTGSFEFCIGFPFNPAAAFRLGSSTGTAKAYIYLGSASTTPTSGSPVTPPAYFRFPVNLPPEGIAPGHSLFFTLTSQGPYASGTNAMGAWDPVRTDLSATIDGDPMAAGDMTQNVFCNLTSGNMDVLLCPTSSTSPSSSQLIATAYQAFHVGDGYGLPWLQSANNGSGASVSSIPMGPASGLVTALPPPVLAYRLGINMSRNQGSTATPRWLATLNPRAGLILRRRSNYCFSLAYPSSLVVLGNECSAAEGVTPSVSGGTVIRPVLTEFQPSGVPLFSLAQLQHAGLSLISLNPAYAVGNSYADYYTARDQTSAAISADTADQLLRVYDLSYLLNQALWDRYFFSTVPTSLTSANQLTVDYHLPNSRNELYWRSNAGSEFGELKTTDTAAAHLLVNGGFNVNSTSIQAWRALLYSHNGPPPSGAASTEKHPFSRFTRPVGTSPNSTWEGYRVLTDAQIDTLAANIVTQVKIRGPFMSLADFVNRRLVDVASTTEDERLKGTLQAALDAPDDVSAVPLTYNNNVNYRAPFRSTDTAYRVTSVEGSTTDQKERYRGGADANAPYASLAAQAPGFLTQADLLSALGPILTARSDTFRIRAYGDTINPTTGLAEGKAWCEAIVQRLPDFVDQTDPALASSGLGSATPLASVNTVNAAYGRRFKIVSFRWLSPTDI